MGRGSTQVLLKKIMEILKQGPKTVSEIAGETGLDRNAIAKYAKILSEGGLLTEEKMGTSKKLIAPAYRPDTYFGLPLDKKAEEQASSVYSLIQKNWKENTTKKLLKTQAQKIAYKAIVSCDLKIPHGWYLYGGISVLAYDDSKDYKYYRISKKAKDVIKKETAEHAGKEFAWQSKRKQYEEAGKELYLKKEEILSILCGPKFATDPKRSLYVLAKKIKKLVSLAPRSRRTEYAEFLDAYQDLMLDMNKLENDVISAHNKEIIQLFEALWKYIALFNFKEDLLNFYSETMLDMRLMSEIGQQEDEITELGTQLQSLVPKEEITDPLAKKLHEALSGIRILSPAEQKVQKAKMKRLEKKMGREKFHEYLRKEAGLD